MIFVAEKNFSFEEYAKERKKRVTLIPLSSESIGEKKQVQVTINPSFLACCGDFFTALATSFNENIEELGDQDNSKHQIDSKYLNLICLLEPTPSFITHTTQNPEEEVQIRVECNQKNITLENAIDLLLVSNATGLIPIQNACQKF